MNEPLGLPRGSVRAILTIGIVGAFIVACFITLPEGSLTALAGLAGVVTRDYYGARQAQNAGDDANGANKSNGV